MRLYILMLIFFNIYNGISCLAATGGSDQDLAELAKGTECEGRIGFAERLSRPETPNHKSLIKSSLYDKCLLVRVAAIEAFGQFANEEDVGSLHKILINEAENNFILEEIFSALTRIHSNSTVALVIDLLNQQIIQDYWVSHSLELLASYETSESISFLINFYNTPKNHAGDRYLALELLSNMKTPEGQHGFELALSSNDPLIKRMAKTVSQYNN